MPEQEPQENNNAPTWADFKPPVLTTPPFGDGKVVNPGLTIPDPAAPPSPQPDPAPAPAPEVIPPPVPPAPSLAPLPEVTPPPASPEPEVTTPPPPVEPAPPDPAPAQPAVEQPIAPEPTPIEPLVVNPVPEQAVPISEPVPSPAAEQPQPSSRRKILLVVIGLIILGGLGGGGYWAWSNNLISLPTSGTSASTTPTVAEDQAILAQAVGPATWENNYSTDLLPTEKGGLEFQVTDPPTAASSTAFPTSASTSATASPLTGLKSLIIKISKVEVHLTSRSVVATGADVTATKSANQSADHWETLRLSGDNSVDLLALRNQGGGIDSLGVTYLAAGHYTEVRIYLTGATAVSQSGTSSAVQLPRQMGLVKLVRSFDVTATGTKAILVDFDLSRSLQTVGSGYQLQPVVGKISFDGKTI